MLVHQRVQKNDEQVGSCSHDTWDLYQFLWGDLELEGHGSWGSIEQRSQINHPTLNRKYVPTIYCPQPSAWALPVYGPLNSRGTNSEGLTPIGTNGT